MRPSAIEKLTKAEIERILTKRILELEAERDKWKSVAIEKDDILDRVKDYPELKARAEKAEEANVYNFQTMKRITAERDSLQASVEELKIAVKKEYDRAEYNAMCVAKNREIRELEAELAEEQMAKQSHRGYWRVRAEKAEGELAARNNGECFGPFHGGFICADCARLTRELQARAEKAEAFKTEILAAEPGKLAYVKELEARVAFWRHEAWRIFESEYSTGGSEEEWAREREESK